MALTVPQIPGRTVGIDEGILTSEMTPSHLVWIIDTRFEAYAAFAPLKDRRENVSAPTPHIGLSNLLCSRLYLAAARSTR